MFDIRVPFALGRHATSSFRSGPAAGWMVAAAHEPGLLRSQPPRDSPAVSHALQLGRATGLPVDAVDYSAPSTIRAVTVAFFILSGISTAWLFNSSLGDATWSVSTGIGSCMAALVYEVGRPKRMSPDEAVELEEQWQDFGEQNDKHGIVVCCLKISLLCPICRTAHRPVF